MFTIGLSRGSHLLLVCSGSPTFDDFLALIDLAGAVARREGHDALLVDALGVPPTFTADQRVELGRYAARTLTGRRVALVVPSTFRFDATRAAAAQAGGALGYFESHDAAQAWLAARGRVSVNANLP
ncbi:MAG: hypothetical protein EOO24_63810 [Comamonadaceae bacterium]|nr:MAG: hypothetical protein EOO24_63810 [Comamonadaceae bacterium]